MRDNATENNAEQSRYPNPSEGSLSLGQEAYQLLSSRVALPNENYKPAQADKPPTETKTMQEAVKDNDIAERLTPEALRQLNERLARPNNNTKITANDEMLKDFEIVH